MNSSPDVSSGVVLYLAVVVVVVVVVVCTPMVALLCRPYHGKQDERCSFSVQERLWKRVQVHRLRTTRRQQNDSFWQIGRKQQCYMNHERPKGCTSISNASGCVFRSS
eukprot:3892833-Amphidinium_carterae.1